MSGLSAGVTAITASFRSSCALTSSGGVKCWGDNAYGQLGDGSNADSARPVDVKELASGVTAITSGGLWSCALTKTGAAKCWGWNDHGQLGNGMTTNTNVPVDVVGLSSGVLAISGGIHHTCALTRAGGVKCWGANDTGQLATASTSDSAKPVDVQGLTSGVAAIAAGADHTCAITTAGAVKCWGYNGEGQLGNGTTTKSPVPVDVTGLASGVTAIASGMLDSSYGGHTCALTASGAVKCWGLNDHGQLGDGSSTNASSPVDVLGLASGVKAITVCGDHTCALTSGGVVLCWGNNVSGQLAAADSKVHSSDVPLVVSGL